jgi:hypothetical protein
MVIPTAQDPESERTDMTRLATRLGDRMLALLLPATDAGAACVPTYGNVCGCTADSPPRVKLVDCYGVCRKSHYPC